MVVHPSQSQKRFLEQTIETCLPWYNTSLAGTRETWERKKRSVGLNEQLAKVKEWRKSNPFAVQDHSHILQVTTI